MSARACRTWSALAVVLTAAGGCGTESAHTYSRNYSLREDIPVDPPGDPDILEGGRLYKQYCGSCHNARPLSERPFGNNEVSLTHMREQAYLTGREYRQITHYLRRWHDVGTPPKRLVFPQPVVELREEAGPEPPKPPPDAKP